MTPLFWISLTWVLATIFVGRLPFRQRFLPGMILAVASVPIVISIAVQMGLLMAILAFAGAVSCFPNVVRLAHARYRGDVEKIDATVLYYLVMPGEV